MRGAVRQLRAARRLAASSRRARQVASLMGASKPIPDDIIKTEPACALVLAKESDRPEERKEWRLGEGGATLRGRRRDHRPAATFVFLRQGDKFRPFASFRSRLRTASRIVCSRIPAGRLLCAARTRKQRQFCRKDWQITEPACIFGRGARHATVSRLSKGRLLGKTRTHLAREAPFFDQSESGFGRQRIIILPLDSRIG